MSMRQPCISLHAARRSGLRSANSCVFFSVMGFSSMPPMVGREGAAPVQTQVMAGNASVAWSTAGQAEPGCKGAPNTFTQLDNGGGGEEQGAGAVTADPHLVCGNVLG